MIALIPAFTYTCLIEEAYSGAPILAAVLVSFIGVLGWLVQGKLSEKIEASQIREEKIEVQLKRRIEKIEAQFMSIKPYNHFSHQSNFILEDRLHAFSHRDSTEGIPPQLLKDMRAFDQDLLLLIDSFDHSSRALLLSLTEFYDLAKEKVEECDRLLNVQAQQPPDRLPDCIRGIFLILSDSVISLEDVSPNKVGTAKVNVTSGVRRFVELLLGREDAQNPYPRLMRDPDLKNLAQRLEDARELVDKTQTTISHILATNYVGANTA